MGKVALLKYCRYRGHSREFVGDFVDRVVLVVGIKLYLVKGLDTA